MNNYTILDSGDGSKLEVIGKYTIIRPSTHSLYPKSLPSIWKDVDAIYTKNETGSGSWKFYTNLTPQLLYFGID